MQNIHVGSSSKADKREVPHKEQEVPQKGREVHRNGQGGTIILFMFMCDAFC